MSKYSLKDSFNDIIDELLIDVYRTYFSASQRLVFYLEFLSSKYFINMDVSSSKEEISNKLKLNFECGDISLNENHTFLKESLSFICRELNKRNVDYYVVGAIPIYIKLNIDFSRFHSDIDIAINSNDIYYLDEIFKDRDYVFFDNRFCSQKFFDYEEKRARGRHEIISQNKNNDFGIGFYEFDRLDDGFLIKKDYFSEIVEGTLISRVCK